MLLPQAREERAGRLGVRERFNKALDVFYHVVVADEEGATLMQAFRDNIQNTLFTVAGLTARLFGEEGHRVAFIQQAQLAFRVAGGARIEIDAAFTAALASTSSDGFITTMPGISLMSERSSRH